MRRAHEAVNLFARRGALQPPQTDDRAVSRSGRAPGAARGPAAGGASGAPSGRDPRDDGGLLGDRGAAAGRDCAHRPRSGDHPRRGARTGGICAICRSDHLPVHRQLHAGRGHVRARPRPSHRVRGTVVARGWRKSRPHPVRLRGGRHGDLDVDQQHRDDRHDVPDRPFDRRPHDRRSRVGKGQPRLRHRDDADHGVRRLSRRYRYTDWDSTQSDRDRHVESHRGDPDLVLSLDALRRSDRGAPLQLPRCLFLFHLAAEPSRRSRPRRSHPCRTAATGPALAGTTQRAHRVRHDGAAVAAARHPDHRRRRRQRIRTRLCRGDAGVGRGDVLARFCSFCCR